MNSCKFLRVFSVAVVCFHCSVDIILLRLLLVCPRVLRGIIVVLPSVIISMSKDEKSFFMFGIGKNFVTNMVGAT